MSNDLISKSAVIKIIEDEIKLKSSYVEHNAWIDIMFKVKGIPTAYNVDRVMELSEFWIPCSEQLPEEGVSVLITVQHLDVQIGYFENGEWYEAGTDFRFLDNAVIAWQPLPEKYKG